MLTTSIKEYVSGIKSSLKEEIEGLSRKPRFAIVKVGHDVGSDSYVKGKVRDAGEVGMEAVVHQYEENLAEDELAREVETIALDRSVDGMIVQLPLPKNIDEGRILSLIPPKKDIDGFSPLSRFVPCTPKGIVDYLDFLGFPFKGLNAVVIGRSNIVGKPLAKLLLSRDMNVTVLHSKTKEEDRSFYIAHADLLCLATGKAGLADARYSYKPSAVIVDVGISRGSDGHLHGDAVPGLPVYLQTPVPGGVGLLTRVSLLRNVMEAYRHGI